MVRKAIVKSISTSASSCWFMICAFTVAFAIVSSFLFVLWPALLPQNSTFRERMTDWDAVNNSYYDDDCLTTWDKIVGGVKSLATFGSFNDNDRANLMDAVDIQSSGSPKYDTCIKRVANYTLVCPDETVFVHGCDGVTYKNACTAERNGIYNYSTENGVITNNG
jgi:hypothetical protein